ncbi:hypothetical protein CLU88_4453 [Acidovorax sp. 56]|uniref:hypothetical protein n=1 Tax=Acidovorax sp. 56 TaxID=2035205 RepID=UPI000C5AEC04|nr:hypothetical protein [Acidovorax sp. 56]PIF29522.1 hypothetical protein CLU88_4453 [Acidovorax sp. 56]
MQPPQRRADFSASSPSCILPLRAGQHQLTCLPPGATLQVLQGSVEVATGPLVYGQVLSTRRQVLQAGEMLPSNAVDMPTWVHLRNAGTTPARVLWTEPPATPGVAAWLQQVGQRIQHWGNARPRRTAGSSLGRTQA